jgi:hypothetical protein
VHDGRFRGAVHCAGRLRGGRDTNGDDERVIDGDARVQRVALELGLDVLVVALVLGLERVPGRQLQRQEA